MFSKKLFQKVMPFLTYRDFSTRLESIYLIECMIQNTLLPNKNKYLDFEADFRALILLINFLVISSGQENWEETQA